MTKSWTLCEANAVNSSFIWMDTFLQRISWPTNPPIGVVDTAPKTLRHAERGLAPKRRTMVYFP